MREPPRDTVKRAVDFMKQQKGRQALELVRDYEIYTFGQLEHWAQLFGYESWREDTPEERELKG